MEIETYIQKFIFELNAIFLSAAQIQGTQVIAKRTFTITQEAVDLDFEGYGIKLHVPEGILPAEVSETQLDVQVSLSGQFQMPSGSKLVSAVYWVSSPHKFTKPITIEVQHCARLTNDKQCSQLTFVHSMHTQKDLPYLFMEQDGGVFTSHSSYGSLSLSHFSGVGIVVRRILRVLFGLQARNSGLGQQQQLSESLDHTEAACQIGQEEEGEVDEQYCAQLYKEVKVNSTRKKWKVDFVVTKDLECCLTVSIKLLNYSMHVLRCTYSTQVVKKEYYTHCVRQFSFVFTFKEDFISLKIPEKDQELDGWRVTPFYTPKVSCFLHENFVVNLIIVFSVTEDHKTAG